MPRYFFQVEDGASLPDLEGTELPDVAAARAEAVRLAGLLLADLGGKFWDQADWRLIVTDDQQQVEAVLTFQGSIPASPVKYEPARRAS